MDEKTKVLIVEDEHIIAAETQQKLRSLGYVAPAIASSGYEAIEISEKIRPDLILMDIVLEGEMDGIEAAERIHESLYIPVVYMTASVNDARLEEIKRTKPFGCLFKPFNHAEMQAAIEVALCRHRMDKELRESELKYRSLASTIDSMYLVDEECRFLFMNEQYRIRLGVELKEIIGKTYWEFHSEEGSGKFAEKIKTIFETGNPIYYEHDSLRDGKCYIRTLSPVKDAGGKIKAVTVVSKDITERRTIEKALRDSESRYRALAETTSDIIFVLDLDRNFSYLNPIVEKYTGYSKQEMIGHPISEFTSQEHIEKIAASLGKEGTGGNKAFLCEIEIRCKNGETVPVELNIAFLPDAVGNTIGRIGIARDITKRKEMERELERRFQYLEGVLETAPYAIITLDQDHRIVRWNQGAENLFRYSQEEVKGKELDGLVAITADTIEEARKATEVVTSGKVMAPCESVRFRKDGSMVNVAVSGSPVVVKGELAGTVAIYDDITDRKRSEEEIKFHREHLAFINQILRHDLTNDLAVIQSAIRLYLKSPEEKLLEEISSRTKKSIELINRMRELESFVSAHRELKVCDIGEVIKKVAKSYPYVDFEIKGRAHVIADDSVDSVVDNIIRNAVMHGKADKILMAIEKSVDTCEVRVADNGLRVPDEIKKKIFEKGFTYGDTAHTGIGLHIVEKAMKTYGGCVWVEDNDPKGSVFIMKFKRVN